MAEKKKKKEETDLNILAHKIVNEATKDKSKSEKEVKDKSRKK
jgi:hypothetical protein